MSTRRNMLRRNDIRFIEFARTLSAADWQQPSLCAQWSNRDVLAHLVYGYRASPVAMTAEMVRNRGSFDRANCALARDVAARSTPAELTDELATLVDAPRGIGRVFPPRLLLGDHVVHELDIALAIDREPQFAADALTAVLETQVRLPNPFIPARTRARGLVLRADDVDWHHGSAGPVVSGSAADLVSVLAGRPRALERLTGDGVALLRSRL